MRTTADPVGVLVGPFVAEAAATRARPPMRLLEHDAYGWPLLVRARDLLLLDEYGDLWWGRAVTATDARVVRACWPEERSALAEQIITALAHQRRAIRRPMPR